MTNNNTGDALFARVHARLWRTFRLAIENNLPKMVNRVSKYSYTPNLFTRMSSVPNAMQLELRQHVLESEGLKRELETAKTKSSRTRLHKGRRRAR